MNIRRVAVLCLFAALTIAYESALESQTTARRDESGLQVVRLSLSKMGRVAGLGRDTISAGTFTSYRTGTAVTKPLTVRTHGTVFLRNEIGDFTFIRAGNHGKSHYDGKDHAVPFHSIAYLRPEYLPALLILTEIESPNLQCTMIGEELVDGIQTSHVRLSDVPSDGSNIQAADLMSETHVWIDQTGLVIKARIFLFSPTALQNRSPVDLHYSDYRQVDQFLVPFHVVRDINHQKDAEINFTSINVNAKLTDADFQ